MVAVSKIRFQKKGLETLLSPLECDILEVLWKKNDAKVRDIYKIVRKKRKVALTSIAVILDRLHKRNLVTRKIESGRGGYHYIYVARISKDDFENSIIEKTVNKLIESFGPNAVNYFNERFKKKV
jgi:predicted transcriptional regulator